MKEERTEKSFSCSQSLEKVYCIFTVATPPLLSIPYSINDLNKPLIRNQ